jgi:two-component system sensor histidine kinase MtrB
MAGTDLRHRIPESGRRFASESGRRLVSGSRSVLTWSRATVAEAGRTRGGRAVRATASPAIRRWRGSLQLRIVTFALVGSAVLVGGFGFVVAERITDGLVEAKVDAALEQITDARRLTYNQLSELSGPNDPERDETADAIVTVLGKDVGPGKFHVVLASGDPKIRIDYRPIGSERAERAAMAIPDELRDVVVGSAVTAYQFTRVALDGVDKVPHLVVGTPVKMSWGSLELYYLFPLDDEIKAAAMVRNTVLITGVALVLLLSLIAWIVTRMVVSPVQVAAATAQRLSAGLLHERIPVRGEDELALLARSFNQMAENLQHQIVQLEELSRLQRRFTSDVSHELRTPLTTVRMAADILHNERAAFSPDVSRSTELLHDELGRFENLLSDLLEISRFDAGFAQLEPEPVDLVPIVRRVVTALTTLARSQQVPIEVRVPEQPVVAEADPRRVERIVRNLLGNAVEHGDGKPACVTLAADAGSVAITVRDHGVGLRPGEDKLVFNRFWRADPSRARQTGGTGLGLSISLEDARLHGGWLEAWGAVGKGSQFRLTLPCRAGDRLVSSPLPLVPEDIPATTSITSPAVGGAV